MSSQLELDQIEQPTTYKGFDHVHFWVGNALQAASYYVSRYGFTEVAYRGLETQNRDFATRVVKQGNILFAFTSPYNHNEQFAAEHGKHGDGVKDVAFAVEDARVAYEVALKNGAVSVHEPHEESDEDGTVVLATVRTYEDTVHTFVQRGDYKGVFLPGYKAVNTVDPVNEVLPPVGVEMIDHIVGNQGWDEMFKAANWYANKLGFKRFWSVDDKQIHTEYSSLRSIVMADRDETIKMPINEPAEGKRKSQIQEYVEYYEGAGVQHIALSTKDILSTVSALKSRGVSFLSVPDTYYADLRKRLEKASVEVKEDLDKIQELNILVDFDEKGYLLQIFTKCAEDRPTLFYEIIQRKNNSGFGIGNFKALFESIERDQELRGNL